MVVGCNSILIARLRAIAKAFLCRGLCVRFHIVSRLNSGRTAKVDIIYKDRVSHLDGAKAEGDNLWLSAADLTQASGWELKPEGACLRDVCVPIPPARESVDTCAP